MKRSDIDAWVHSEEGREGFWAHVVAKGEHLLWTGTMDHGVVPTWKVSGRSFSARRLMLDFSGVATPEHLHFVRTCDELACIKHAVPAAGHNSLRSHCANGHELSNDNLVRSVQHERRCLTCHRAQSREAVARYRARKKAAASN